MFNPLRYHLILGPYISSNSRQWKHTTHIWIKITWHYSALWFFYYLDYVAKIRQANVSRNKSKLNKVILVSISNLIDKKAISFPISRYFYNSMAAVDCQSAAVRRKSHRQQGTPHYSHPRLILVSATPAHPCQHWPHPIAQIIHHASLYSLESRVQLHKQQEVIFNTVLPLPRSLWCSIQSSSNSTC